MCLLTGLDVLQEMLTFTNPSQKTIKPLYITRALILGLLHYASSFVKMAKVAETVRRTGRVMLLFLIKTSDSKLAKIIWNTIK